MTTRRHFPSEQRHLLENYPCTDAATHDECRIIKACLQIDDGTSFADVAHEFDVSERTVRNWWRKIWEILDNPPYDFKLLKDGRKTTYAVLPPHATADQKVGFCLRYWRLKRGSTQEEVAAEVGCTPKQISHFECGKQRIPNEVFLKLIQFNGIPYKKAWVIFNLYGT